MGKKPDRIPARFEKYFWDCEFETLRLEDHKKFIAERILMFGDIPALKWLRETYGLEFFRHIAVSGRRLDHKTRNFWKIYFNGPPTD